MEKHIRDGLILRSLSEGHQSDRDQLGDFYHSVYSVDDDWDESDQAWVNKLLSGDHPTISFDDVWVVVDPANDDKIVSSTLLIPQVWRYAEVEFPMGRPELVATDPAYRNRGLIRALFEVCHERSAELGHKLLAITGIPHYYRRFGYTMAVDLGHAGSVPLHKVPALKDGKSSQYHLRDVREADYPKLSAWDDYNAPQFALSVARKGTVWSWRPSFAGPVLKIIVDDSGQDVGYLAVLHKLAASDGEKWIYCGAYLLGEKSSYVATYPDVLRGIKALAESLYAPEDLPAKITFAAGQHPALRHLLGRDYEGRVNHKPYAWYLRVPDLPDFLMTVKPVLERRLLRSGAHRYTGTLAIELFNQSGLRLIFEDGCLHNVESFDMINESDKDCDAGFPEDYLLHLIFGHRNWEELRHVLTEVYANGKAAVMLNALFPKQPSHIFAIS